MKETLYYGGKIYGNVDIWWLTLKHFYYGVDIADYDYFVDIALPTMNITFLTFVDMLTTFLEH